jgi:hypothetical protein
LIGLSLTQFDNLFSKINWNQETSNQYFSHTESLVITLLWMRQYPTLKFLAWIYQCDSSTIGRVITNTLNKLWEFTKNIIRVLPFTTRLLTAKNIWKYLVVMVIDGTEQNIYQSSKKIQANITFSGKKKHHTFTKLLFVSPTGSIWYLSPSYPGSVSDINLSSFPENFIYQNLTDEEWIIGDSGFNGLEWAKILSYSSFKSGPYSKEYLKIRSVVENTIAAVKKWKICSLTFRKTLTSLDKTREHHHKIWTFVVVCIFYIMNHLESSKTLFRVFFFFVL